MAAMRYILLITLLVALVLGSSAAGISNRPAGRQIQGTGQRPSLKARRSLTDGTSARKPPDPTVALEMASESQTQPIRSTRHNRKEGSAGDADNALNPMAANDEAAAAFVDAMDGTAQAQPAIPQTTVVVQPAQPTNTWSTQAMSPWANYSLAAQIQPWIPLIVVIAVLLVLACLVYVFRKHIPTCVHWIEVGCEWFVWTVLLPFRFLRALLRRCFYPLKQGCVRMYTSCHEYCYPASVRV